MGLTFPIRYKTQPRRELCSLRGGHIVTEHGETFTVPSWGALKYAMFVGNWTVYTDGILSFPWLEDAVMDKDTTVFLNRQERPTSIHVRYKTGHKRWIVPMESWKTIPNDLEGLTALRETLRWCNIGDYGTPSGVGLALMAEMYPRDADRCYVLPPSAWNVFYETLIGGRSDAVRKDHRFPVLWSIDLNSAYAASIQMTPFGPMTLTHGGFYGSTGYYHIRWRAPAHPPIILPLGVPDGEGEMQYPTVGEHEGWYWQESIRLAQDRGISVTDVWEGYSWPLLADVFRPWSLHMHNLRDHPWPDVQQLVKFITVASIGRLASDARSKTLVVLPAGGDHPYVDRRGGGIGNRFWVHEEEQIRAEHLIHIASFVYDQCRIRLFGRAEHEGGHLVSTNYDEVYTDLEPTGPGSAGLGEWKHRPLHNAVVREKRWIESDEKTRTPGVPRRL